MKIADIHTHTALCKHAEGEPEEYLAAKCRERGTMPKDCDKFISPGKPQMNWKRLLSDFITQSIQRSRSWLPPNRRHVYKKLYLPGSIKNPDIEIGRAHV